MFLLQREKKIMQMSGRREKIISGFEKARGNLATLRAPPAAVGKAKAKGVA